MGQNEIRKAPSASERSAISHRAQVIAGKWATYALADEYGRQETVIRVPLDRGVIDVIQFGGAFYYWCQNDACYRRARFHMVQKADEVKEA